MKSHPGDLSRRDFLAATTALGTLAGTLRTSAADAPAAPAPVPAGPPLKIGLVGAGGRGSWIAGLFREHGGYTVHALADYFPAVAQKQGEALGVDPARRFSGLSGYKRLIESGVEAVLIETPPYFMPEIAIAAVAAGLHVYMAKPVAADVPGTLQILEAGKAATAKQRVFLVDYQMPTDPVNLEIRKRILAGAIGRIVSVNTIGTCGGFADPPKGPNLESRLQGLVWVNDVALGCDYIGNYDIHAIDAALWVLGRRPVAAIGASRILRANPHGDARDLCQVIYEYADGLVHTHEGIGLGHGADGALTARILGDKAHAELLYWGRSLLRGGEQATAGKVEDLYKAGAVRNIAAFHAAVRGGRFENETVGRAVDGCLTCILGREAAARGTRLTMDELIRENRRLEVDLAGLKA